MRGFCSEDMLILRYMCVDLWLSCSINCWPFAFSLLYLFVRSQTIPDSIYRHIHTVKMLSIDEDIPIDLRNREIVLSG